ncbi:MAG: hypothetical protein GXX96_09095 [Planctomycetaceae bacterium]|nr:hypothetical protein [Planctomycetaceae bacterium]
MSLTAEQRRIFNAKPIHRMRWFASLLHWHGLQLERIVPPPDEAAGLRIPEPGIIAFYMTTDWKFNLQINETPIGQSVTHQATIKADRYGINRIDWHPFTLFDDDEELKHEAERLRPWLDRKLYKDRKWLRAFRQYHPELLLPSRKKCRGR